MVHRVPPQPSSWAPGPVEDAYRRVLRDIRRANLDDDVVLTSHWPLVGTADRRILIIGQAVFGWIPSWRQADIGSDLGIDRVLKETQAACYERADPMDWILENRVRSSPFWRVTRGLVELTFLGSPLPWYSHIAWANTYPVARNDIKGNPEGSLRSAQASSAAELLDTVATSLSPDAVVILGGGYWWDVADRLQFTRAMSVERPLLAAGERHGMPWVAGWHPGGAQRRGWPANRYAALLRETVDRLGSV